MPNALYTIGHSTHATPNFIKLLQQHRVTAVCDVRSHPYSRHTPEYNRETIAGEMKRNGISYVFLGAELGARSDDAGCYLADKVQFEKLTATPLFQRGLMRLEQGMETHTIALMCAEKDPIACHRAILVARQFREKVIVKHILEDGRIENTEALEKRLMHTLKIQPDLVRDERQCIEEAYALQGRKIAYVKKAVRTPEAESHAHH